MAWPLAARGQQPAIPVIGFLGATALDEYTSQQVAAFRQGLTEVGLVENRDIAIEFRWAEGNYDRLPALASERHRAAVILAGSLPSALAAKQATSEKKKVVKEFKIYRWVSGPCEWSMRAEHASAASNLSLSVASNRLSCERSEHSLPEA